LTHGLLVPIVVRVASDILETDRDRCLRRSLIAAPALGLLPCEQLVGIAGRPFLCAALFLAFILVTTTTNPGRLVSRAFYLLALTVVGTAPLLSSWPRLWVSQGGPDDLVYSLGGSIFMSTIISQASFPLWNPFYLMGTPLAADPIWGA